jgi:hypothetical protein
MRALVTLTLIALTSSSPFAFADENEVLFRVTCQPDIPAFEIHRLDYQNISHVLRPDDLPYWRDDLLGGELRRNNIQVLERLEHDFDLYTLYDNRPIFSKRQLEWKCGFLDAKIAFVVGWDGRELRTSPPYARIDPTLTITRSGSPILGPVRIFGPYPRQVITSIRTYGQDDQTPFVEVCSALKCGVRSALEPDEFEPVTDDDVTEWLRDRS